MARLHTLKYYEKAMNNDSLIGLRQFADHRPDLHMVISVILGAMVAVLLWRFRFPGKAPLEGAMALPIVIPEICMGVAMLAFFARIGWPSGMPWPFNLGPSSSPTSPFPFPLPPW